MKRLKVGSPGKKVSTDNIDGRSCTNVEESKMQKLETE